MADWIAKANLNAAGSREKLGALLGGNIVQVAANVPGPYIEGSYLYAARVDKLACRQGDLIEPAAGRCRYVICQYPTLSIEARGHMACGELFHLEEKVLAHVQRVLVKLGLDRLN